MNGMSRTQPLLSEAQILLERIEEAIQPGTPVIFRRRVLAEAAIYVRQQMARSAPSSGCLSRFEPKFEYDPNAGCWLWSCSTDADGYGRFVLDGRLTGAHRAAWRIYRGEIAAGLFVLHRCDTPACVNPAHLFLGTHDENMADRQRKGRGGVQRGEANSQARLTDADADAIRNAGGPQHQIAEDFGVSPSLVSLIRSGKAWAHLGEPS